MIYFTAHTFKCVCHCTGWPICIWTILWGCLEVTRWLRIKKFNSSKKFMQILLKVSKVYFFDINHGLTMILWTFFTKSKNYAKPMYGLQYPWSRRAMDKGKIEAMVTKFSEKFAIIMLKKHRKFCRCGLIHLDTTPIFKKSFRYLWATLYIKTLCWRVQKMELPEKLLHSLCR